MRAPIDSGHYATASAVVNACYNGRVTEAPRVVVVGAGFAGLHAVRRLARARVPTLWIDRRNYHAFLPLCYQVATAGLEPQEIAYPARSILRRLPSVDFRLAEIASASPRERLLLTTDGERIPYDYLIVAAGGRAQDFGIPGVGDSTFGLYDVEDARRLRNHLLRVLEHASVTDDEDARAALLTFVIVGGGPTGVETAGALAEFRRHVLPRDYRRLRDASMRIVLVEAGPDLLPPFAPRLRARARHDLESTFHVEVRANTRVSAVTADGVTFADGEHLPTATVIWAAGIQASAVAARLGLPTGTSGRLRVDETLRVVGEDRIFAAGDVALVEGVDVPQLAQGAIQGGRHAAANVLRAYDGAPLLPFRYRDKGVMATIGRSRAVATIAGWSLAGWFAWWCWLAVHLVMLVGFRNRLVVFVNWVWNYLTYDRGLRAILGAPPAEAPPAPQKKTGSVP